MPTATTNTKPPSKRLATLVRRSLAQRARGITHFNKSRETLQKAISAGLQVGHPIEIDVVDEHAGTIHQERFVLVDNFEGEKSGGWATVNRFELKKAAKNPRRSTGVPPVGTPGVSPDAPEEAAS